MSSAGRFSRLIWSACSRETRAVPQQPALARVQKATRRLEKTTAEAEAAREEWLEAMRLARREGASYRAIAEVAGVSRQRVAELLGK
jgi:predicted DNA-binding protein (UPF0251 family)